MLSIINAFFLLGCQSTSFDNQLNYRNALITIEIITKNNEQLSSQSGMGFMLTKDEFACYVVTAKHVIPYPYEKIIYKHWNSSINHEDIEFIGASSDLDIAVLKLPIKDDLCTPVNTVKTPNLINLGEEVLIFGHPAIKYNEMPTQYYKSAAHGVISTVLDNYNGQSFSAFASTAIVSPGFSGGAVFSSFKANSVKVIGMVIENFNQNSNQIHTSSPSLSIIIPSNILLQSTNEIIADYKLSKNNEMLEPIKESIKLLVSDEVKN